MRAVYRIVFMLAAFNNYSSRRSQIRADKFKVEIPGLRQKARARARPRDSPDRPSKQIS